MIARIPSRGTTFSPSERCPRTPAIAALDVVTGADVAYAYALLRCGTPAELAARPEQQGRLIIGLGKEYGHWVVGHEHHSFASVDE